MATPTAPAAKAPERLSANIAQTFPSAQGASDDRTPAERQLDAAFRSWLRLYLREQPGREPRWTPNLRAEMWARFALECTTFVKNSGVPARQQGWNLNSLRANPLMPPGYRELAGILADMLDAPTMQAVIGEVGTGKSSLAWGLVMHFCGHGRPALYRTLDEMIHELTAAGWEAKDRVRSNWQSVALLVIDEVEAGVLEKGWVSDEFKTLIDQRYRDGRATLLLSNLMPQALNESVGAKVWRRLTEEAGPPIECDWGRIRDHLAKRVGTQPN